MDREVSCHFCGDTEQPHMLADCRPDLVQHEIGPDCTWAVSLELGIVTQLESCYAYQDPWTKEWGTEHKHFFPNESTTGYPEKKEEVNED